MMVADAVVDVLVVTGPVSRARAQSFTREADILRASGFSVAVRRQGAGPLPRSILAVLVAVSQGTGLGPDTLWAERIVVRVRACDDAAATAALAGALERSHARPVWLAPEGAGVRRALREHVPAIACTAEDLPPAVDPLLGVALGRSPPKRAPRRLDVVMTPGRSGTPQLAPVGAEHPGARRGLRGRTLVVLHGAPPPGCDVLPTALRCLEAGGLVVASTAWNDRLDGAALLVPAAGLADVAADLARDARAFADMRRQVVGTALRTLSEERMVRLARGSCPGYRRDPALPGLRSPRRADLVVAGDFTLRDETVLQALASARTRLAAGASLLLLHLPGSTPWAGGVVHPGFEALVADRAASVLDPQADVAACEELLLFGARPALAAIDRLRPRIACARVTLLTAPNGFHRARPAKHLCGRVASLLGAPCAIRATVPAVEDPAEEVSWKGLQPSIPAFEAPSTDPAARPRGRPILGCVVFSVERAQEVVQRLDQAGLLKVATLRLLPVASPIEPFAAVRRPDVEVLDLDGFDIGRFVAGCDAICAPPDASAAEVGWSSLATAERLQRLVLLPPGLGVADGEALPLESWADRLRALPEVPRGRACGRRVESGRVLLVTANGVGLGHLTRLAAIARHLPSGLEPVFATMSQAVAVLQELGFRAELLTSYTGHPPDTWNDWLRRRLAEILEAERPRAVVLDSSNPYPGVLRAAVARTGIGLVWVRRGMWRADQDNARFLAHAGAFDLIVEPADLAEDADRGATAQLRPNVLRVPPVSLLDEADLLPRAAARTALGLDPDQPAVLVQLGSGTTRDLTDLLDRVFGATRRFPGLQVVHAEWLIAAHEADLWPQVRRMRGFPIARYFRAFDFTISAAGYNSFNDILRFGLPAIFVANDAPMMDDQGARAAFAQGARAAFDLRADALDEIETCIGALLDPRVRDHLADNARRLGRGNGAAAAARAVAAVAASAAAG